jgi:thymidylate synthase
LPSCKIWDAWADSDGDLGKIYGYQWRKADGIDQVAKLIAGIKSDPFSRRHIVNAWNVKDLPEMALTPCHNEFQCYVSKANDGGANYLSLRISQRSADAFIGICYNIPSYALLTHLIARATGLRVGELVYIITGDAHIYLNHIEQVKTLLQRTPPAMPKLIIKTDNIDIDGYKLSDFALENYTHLGELKGEIAV